MTLVITDPSTEDERVISTRSALVDKVRITEISVQNERKLVVRVKWLMGYEDGEGIFQPVSDGRVELNGDDAISLFAAIEDSVFRYLIAVGEIPAGDQI